MDKILPDDLFIHHPPNTFVRCLSFNYFKTSLLIIATTNDPRCLIFRFRITPTSYSSKPRCSSFHKFALFFLPRCVLILHNKNKNGTLLYERDSHSFPGSPPANRHQCQFPKQEFNCLAEYKTTRIIIIIRRSRSGSNTQLSTVFVAAVDRPPFIGY